MKLIVGLGNPGLRYRQTRHNIGFMVIDRLASSCKIKINRRHTYSLYGRTDIGGEGLLLAKPITYMNLSGKAVLEIKEKEDVPLKDMLVVLDDADLPLGKIRLRPQGSSGSHKGLRSIIEELETENFPRLRVGIAKEDKEGSLTDYVLAPFRKTEKRIFSDSIEKSALCIKVWVKEGIEAAMNRFNSTTPGF